MLESYSSVVLAEMPVTDDQVQMLRDYVTMGGLLVAMRPDARLGLTFGVEALPGVLENGYLAVEPENQLAVGVETSTVQFHGPASLYGLQAATTIAWLYENATTRTRWPAVTVNSVGVGTAVLWAFDLARSVALTRQGNPAWANQNRDGLSDLAAVDMFVGWVDTNRIAIAQAEEPQRLLVNILLSKHARFPLPRLWYYPGDADSLLVATGDCHGDPLEWIAEMLSRLDGRGGTMTVYYAAPGRAEVLSPLRQGLRNLRRAAASLPVVGDAIANKFLPPTPEQVAARRALGHEFGIHPYVEDGVREAIGRHIAQFLSLGLGPVPRTVRTHCCLWTGWVETARIQAEYGFRMNLDYYHFSPYLRDSGGKWVFGHFTGGAYPMRFVDEQGGILDIYQQPTQLVDEHLLKVFDWGPGLDGAGAVAVSRELIDRAVERSYGPIATQFHVDGLSPDALFRDDARAFVEGTVDYARSKGMAVWSAQRWLTFVESRRKIQFEALSWNEREKTLEFAVIADGPAADEVMLMLPAEWDGKRLSTVTVDGVLARPTSRSLAGKAYACLAAAGGEHRVSASFGAQDS
jgi:hypothetical protein